MGVLRVKEGVEFSIIAPGGFRILAALDKAAQSLGIDLTITSGTDGIHSGPADPHHTGNAYDIRTRNLPFPQQLLDSLIGNLAIHDPDRFYAFIEDPGTDNEHIHCQTKKGTVYP